MKARASIAAATVIGFLAVAPAAHAQSLTDVLTFLVTNQSVPTGSVERDRAAAEAAAVTISRSLLSSLATLPVASSSSAFVYRLNPELGTVERSTRTFGPFFLERAATGGRGQPSLGLTVQHLTFTSLDGRNLANGSLVTTANAFKDEKAPFDVDALTLHIAADVATLYGNVGVTNRMDVGFAAPVVALRIDGSRLDTYRGQAFRQAAASGRTIGLADLVVRAKYTLVDGDVAALATAVDVRLPTGRQEDLLGTGSTSYKFSAIGSLESGRWSAHANAGMSRGGLAPELSYGAAFAVAATSTVSLVGEVLGRWIDGAGHLIDVTAAHPTLAGVNTIRLSGDTSNVHLVSFVPGFKWNLGNTWVLAGNVAIPLTTSGLTTRFTPFVGLDYTLGR